LQAAYIPRSALRPRFGQVPAGKNFQSSGDGTCALDEKGIPRLKQAPGFVAANWVSLDDGTGRGMVVFESEEAARAAAEQIRTNPPAGDAVTIDSIEVAEDVGTPDARSAQPRPAQRIKGLNRPLEPSPPGWGNPAPTLRRSSAASAFGMALQVLEALVQRLVERLLKLSAKEARK
jgi:hypothetical protein